MLKKVSIVVAVAVAIAALLWAIKSPGALADTYGARQACRAAKYEAALKEIRVPAEGGDVSAQDYPGALYSDGKAGVRFVGREIPTFSLN
jgi:hypothetical protein